MADGPLTPSTNPVSGLPTDSGAGTVPTTIPMAPPGQGSLSAPPVIAATSPAAAPAIGNVPPPLPPHISKLAAAGHIFSTLSGKQNEYSIDPKTGQTITTPVQRKPGQMFRDMLAGALMGGASGAGHDFATGAPIGGNAVLQDQRRQDLVRRGQTQDQFKNQLEAQRNQRENVAFQSSEQLKQAEIAHMNIATVRENQLLQGENFKMHAEQSDFGKAQMQPFLDAGIKPVYSDVPESQMKDILKNTPSAGTLMWEPTGVKTGVDTNGKPTYESTYTAIDPSGKVTVTSGMIATLKKSGMDTYDPGLFETLKPGAQLDARQYMTLVNRSQGLMNQKLANEKTAAETDEAKARAGQANAAASRDLAAAAKDRLDIKTSGLLNKAIDALNDPSVGGDFDKLRAKNPGAALVIGESTGKIISDLTSLYRTQSANQDPAAKDTLQQIETFADLTASALGKGKGQAGAGTTPPPTPGTPEAEAAKTASTITQQAVEKQDKDLVDQYEKPFSGSNAQLSQRFGAAATQSDAIQATLKANPKWSTAEKARYIRQVTGGSAAAIPTGALTATNPQTGQKKYSTDGGKTWVDVK